MKSSVKDDKRNTAKVKTSHEESKIVQKSCQVADIVINTEQHDDCDGTTNIPIKTVSDLQKKNDFSVSFLLIFIPYPFVYWYYSCSSRCDCCVIIIAAKRLLIYCQT